MNVVLWIAITTRVVPLSWQRTRPAKLANGQA